MTTNWKKIWNVVDDALAKDEVGFSPSDTKTVVDTIQKVLLKEWTNGYTAGYSQGWAIGKKKRDVKIHESDLS